MASDDQSDPLLPSPTNGFNTRASSFIAAWEQSDAGDEQKIKTSYESGPLHYSPHIPDSAYVKPSKDFPDGYSNRSGVTLGFGYDVGQHTYDDLQRTWGGSASGPNGPHQSYRRAVLSPDQLAALEPYTSAHTVTVTIKGKKQVVPVRPPRAALTALRTTIHVQYSDAKNVFEDTTLPAYRADTYAQFPGLKDMDPWTKAAILDMTYQRGVNVKGAPVMEIKKALLRQDTKAIAAALHSMTVFHARRVSEAKMIEDHLIPGQQWLDYMDRHPPADAAAASGSSTTP